MNWIKVKIEHSKKISLQLKKQKQFGFLVSIFVLLFLVKNFYKNGFILDGQQLILICVLVLCVSITIVKSELLKIILFFWMLLGQVLGEITSAIVLVITYYIFLTPIVIFVKLFEKKNNTKGWINKQNKIDYTKLH